MSASDQDLAGLPEDVREALSYFADAETALEGEGHNGAMYTTIRAELSKLHREVAKGVFCANMQTVRELQDAEAELAALKRRIAEAATGVAKRSLAPGCLVIEGFDDDPGDFHNERVALLPVGGE